jgi:hypothetical protein
VISVYGNRSRNSRSGVITFSASFSRSFGYVSSSFRSQRPDGAIVAEHSANPIVRDGRAERQLERDGHIWQPGILTYLEYDRRLIGLPAPCWRLAVSLVDRDRNNVSEKMAELDKERLRRQRKDAELPDLFLLDPLLHLSSEDPSQIALLDRPVRLFMIGV